MSSGLHAAIVARDPDAISAAIYAELIPVIPDATDPLTYDPRELGASGGNVFKGVAWQGKHWWRDDSSTAAADNITCIILADGGHYLTDELVFPSTVESRALATPPDSAGTDPSVVGKAWIVAAAGTDTWASHDGAVALGSARGWQFHGPEVGEEHYVRDEKAYVTFTDDNVWDSRIAAFGTVWPANLGWDNRVQNQTTNAPPATWSKGVAYIVGSSPTGAWATLSGKIALAESDGVLANGDAFTILTPYTGQQVFDISLGIRVQWNGSAWSSAAGSIIGYRYIKTDNASNNSYIGTSGAYSYSSGTAPQSTVRHNKDTSVLTYAARDAANVLRFKYRVLLPVNTLAVGLFRDSEVNALDWIASDHASDHGPCHESLTFLIAADDTDSHTYYVGIYEPSANSVIIDRRLFEVEEIVAG